MRSANGDTSTSLWVGIFSAGSASTAVPATAGGPFASFARSALLGGAGRATEKKKKNTKGNRGWVFLGRGGSGKGGERHGATARALPCRTCRWPESARAPR